MKIIKGVPRGYSTVYNRTTHKIARRTNKELYCGDFYFVDWIKYDLKQNVRRL